MAHFQIRKFCWQRLPLPPMSENRKAFSFDNTQIAFQSKSNTDLRKARWLFRAFGWSWLIQVGPALTETAFRLGIPIKGIIRKTIFAQFCGGETIADSEKTIQHLASLHVGTILDYSVEGAETDEVFDHTTQELLRTIEKASGNAAIPFSVFKVTGVASMHLLELLSTGAPLSDADQAALQRVINRLDTLCGAAHRLGVRLFFDAEESWIQPAIDDFAKTYMQRYNVERTLIFNTIQLYRHDRLAFLKQSIEQGHLGGYHLGFKLVRGAYMEKERQRAIDMGYPDPIQPTLQDTHRDFDLAVMHCLENSDMVAVVAGTHNAESCRKLADAIDQKGMARNDQRVWFSQLLGMSDHLSYNLADAGFNVAKYVPYGPVRAVMPYLIRRAKENTSVKGQAGRELSLIETELKRRNK